jgi:hypothetical protein
MALTSSSFFDSDAVGSIETITLEPVAPATTTDALIATAFYGVTSAGAPVPVPIDTGGKSFSFSVQAGIFALTVTVVSPSPGTQDVQLCQGTTQIDLLTIQSHSGSGAVLIRGIAQASTVTASAYRFTKDSRDLF